MLGYKLFQGGHDTLSVAAIVQDVGTAIVAAGTDQSGATELTNTLNGIGTVAAGAGVILYSLSTFGDCQIVYNGGANAVKVYPKSGSKINGIATNGPHVLAPNTVCEYWTLTSTQVVGVLSA